MIPRFNRRLAAVCAGALVAIGTQANAQYARTALPSVRVRSTGRPVVISPLRWRASIPTAAVPRFGQTLFMTVQPIGAPAIAPIPQPILEAKPAILSIPLVQSGLQDGLADLALGEALAAPAGAEAAGSETGAEIPGRSLLTSIGLALRQRSTGRLFDGNIRRGSAEVLHDGSSAGGLIPTGRPAPEPVISIAAHDELPFARMAGYLSFQARKSDSSRLLKQWRRFFRKAGVKVSGNVEQFGNSELTDVVSFYFDEGTKLRRTYQYVVKNRDLAEAAALRLAAQLRRQGKIVIAPAVYESAYPNEAGYRPLVYYFN